MATTTVFAGKPRIEPGSYAEVISGIPVPPAAIATGIIMLVDTGSGAGWGAAGIAGEFTSGARSIQTFTSATQMRDAVRGGLFYDLAPYLFDPGPANEPGVQGAQAVMFVRCCATTAARIELDFNAEGSTLKGKIVIRPRAEGVGANGVVTGSYLTRGYAARLSAGRNNAAKLVLTLYQGSFTGTDADGLAFDGVEEINSRPRQLVSSIEFSTVAEFLSWANRDPAFQRYFVVDSTSAAGTGTTTTGGTAILTTSGSGNDLTTLGTGNKLATGATEEYDTNGVYTHVDAWLDSVGEMPHNFFLSDRAGGTSSGVMHPLNTRIQAHILQAARFPKQLVLGGGNDETEATTADGSLTAAATYDSHAVVVVHSAIEVDGPRGAGLVQRSSLYHAALVLGRIAGLDPQEPLTQKGLGKIKALVHELKLPERELFLQGGVLHSLDDGNGSFIVNQAINTLQRNTVVTNPDGHSFDWTSERIDAHLVNWFQVRPKQAKLVGKNRFTLSNSELKTWTEKELQSLKAKPGEDNILLDYRNVVVTTTQGATDARSISFQYDSNGSINKLFFTGIKTS